MEASAERYTFHGFELDPIGCELRREGAAIKLEKIPFELLTLLVRRSGELIGDVCRGTGPRIRFELQNARLTGNRNLRTARCSSNCSKIRPPAGFDRCSATSRDRARRYPDCLQFHDETARDHTACL